MWHFPLHYFAPEYPVGPGPLLFHWAREQACGKWLCARLLIPLSLLDAVPHHERYRVRSIVELFQFRAIQGVHGQQRKLAAPTPDLGPSPPVDHALHCATLYTTIEPVQHGGGTKGNVTETQAQQRTQPASNQRGYMASRGTTRHGSCVVVHTHNPPSDNDHDTLV